MLDFTHQLIDDSVVISLIGSLLNEMSKKAVLDMVQTYLEQGKLLFIIKIIQRILKMQKIKRSLKVKIKNMY